MAVGTVPFAPGDGGLTSALHNGEKQCSVHFGKEKGEDTTLSELGCSLQLVLETAVKNSHDIPKATIYIEHSLHQKWGREGGRTAFSELPML